MQFSDPRPAQMAPGEIRLPAGWEKEFDLDGDVYFVNHDSGIRSYDDPRRVINPHPANTLKRPHPRSNLEVTTVFEAAPHSPVRQLRHYF